MRLTLTDTDCAPDQQEPREYLVEMPAGYDPARVTWEDVIADGAMRIVDEDAFRAAYWTDYDGGELLLTGPEHAGLSDDELMAEAWAEAGVLGVDLSDGEIEIGEWVVS